MSSEISVLVSGMEMVVSAAGQPSLWSEPSGSGLRFRPVTGQNSWKGRFARPFFVSSDYRYRGIQDCSSPRKTGLRSLFYLPNGTSALA